MQHMLITVVPDQLLCLKSPICGAVLTLKNLNYKQCLNLFLRRKSTDIKKAELALRSRDHIADHCRNDR